MFFVCLFVCLFRLLVVGPDLLPPPPPPPQPQYEIERHFCIHQPKHSSLSTTQQMSQARFLSTRNVDEDEFLEKEIGEQTNMSAWPHSILLFIPFEK